MHFRPIIFAFLALLFASSAFGEDRIPFREGVLAALSKQGCSAGACHGSPTGKGGFRLSLRGFDPALDELTLLREDFGRRVNPQDPDASLLLMKPLMQVSHGGGQKLRKSDLAYAVLRGWIAQGAQADPPGALSCLRIEGRPKLQELRYPIVTQQLEIVGHFSDGSTKDLTGLTVFSSSDDSVATVSEAGLVTATDRGEVTILARYLDHIDTANITFHREVPGFAWSNPPAHNFIDEHVFAKLKKLQIPPSDLCSDQEFIRRVYVDVLGVLPTRTDIEAFLADALPSKRDALIDKLLERPEFAEQLAQRWADVLRIKSGKLGSPAAYKFHRWLLEAMQRNMPYDELVRTVLTAEGSTLANPPANFYRAATDPNECAEATAQLLLAARIQCAKCHNHPFDRWSQNEYHALGAFFARVGRKTTQHDGEMLIYTTLGGEVTQPRTGQIVAPSVPGMTAGSTSNDRRVVLADWLASKDNRHFAKVGANRIWSWLFGRGIVEPVDDFRDSNPPANADLLNALADEFIRSGYNQKHLVRMILKSRTYQLSSAGNELNRRDNKYFSHYPARLLSAEQLLDAICTVTDVPQQYPGLPAGTRAGQLPTPEIGGHFLKVFGQPSRDTVCDCERGKEPKLTQPLTLLGGELISQKLRDRRSRLSRHLGDLSGRLSAAGEPPREGLALWLRAEAGVEDERGQAAIHEMQVARWRDQGGKSRTAEQSDLSRRPTFVNDAIAGLPALRFDGVDDFLSNTTDNLTASGAPRTVLAVGQVAKNGRGGAIICFRRTTAGGGTVFAAQHINLGGIYYVYSDGVNGAGNSTLPIDQFAALQSPFITAFVSRGAGEKLTVSVNGRLQPVAQPASIGPDSGAAGFTIGSREDIPPGAQCWSGDLAEILVYEGALSDEQLQAAGSYLTTKYDLRTEYRLRAIATEAASQSDQAARDRAFVAELYYLAFSRPPSEQEISAALDYVGSASDRRQGWEDVCWAVLNSKEFLFQH